MEGNTNALQEQKQELRFDLGTFEGFDFRTPRIIERRLTKNIMDKEGK